MGSRRAVVRERHRSDLLEVNEGDRTSKEIKTLSIKRKSKK